MSLKSYISVYYDKYIYLYNVNINSKTMQNTIFVIFFSKKRKKIQFFSNSHQKIFLINFIINLLLFTKKFLLAFMEIWIKAVLTSTFFKYLFLT